MDRTRGSNGVVYDGYIPTTGKFGPYKSSNGDACTEGNPFLGVTHTSVHELGCGLTEATGASTSTNFH